MQNQTCKAHLPNQTKLSQQSLLNKTKLNLLVKEVNAWVRSTFGNVFLMDMLKSAKNGFLNKAIHQLALNNMPIELELPKDN